MVGVVYTPAYVVSVDGVDLGLVQEPQVFEQVMDRVENFIDKKKAAKETF